MARTPLAKEGVCSFHTARQMSKLQDFGRHPKRRVLARIVPSGVSQFRTHDDAPRVYLVLFGVCVRIITAVPGEDFMRLRYRSTSPANAATERAKFSTSRIGDSFARAGILMERTARAWRSN
jgi:hypothetical protein